jgi:hypothetical protein
MCEDLKSESDTANIDNREEVIKMIENHARSYDMGILAGDNIYPYKVSAKRGDKTEKVKGFSTKSIRYMSDVYRRLSTATNKPLNIVVGNHDIESVAVLKEQIKAFHMKANAYAKYSTKFPNAAWLFIDTEMLQESPTVLDATNHNENIPNGIDVNDVDLSTFYKDKTATDVVKRIAKFLIKNPRKICFIVGHEPLYTIRVKKQKPVLIESFKTSTLIAELICAHSRCIYLCADTHNMQFHRISMKGTHGDNSFYQLIAGTGGAELDELPNPEITAFTNDNVAIEIQASSGEYGYMDIQLVSDHINFAFHTTCSNGTNDTIRWSLNKQFRFEKEERRTDSCTIDTSQNACPVEFIPYGTIPEVNEAYVYMVSGGNGKGKGESKRKRKRKSTLNKQVQRKR